MLNDEFRYRPYFNPLFRAPSMIFQDDDGGSDDDSGGGGDVHFTEKYESLKGNAVLSRYKTEEDAHKGHLEARAVISDPLRLPKSLGKVTDEQKAEWNARVGKLRGVPDKAQDYVVKEPKDLPEGIKLSEEDLKAAKEMAKTLHVPQENLQAFYNFQLNMMARQLEKHAKDNEESYKACVEELEELWGKDKCKENCELVKRALRSIINPDWYTVKEEDDEAWQDYLDTVYINKINNNSTLMKLLSMGANQLESSGKLLTGTHGDFDTTGEKDENLSEEQIQKKHFPKSAGMLD